MLNPKFPVSVQEKKQAIKSHQRSQKARLTTGPREFSGSLHDVCRYPWIVHVTYSLGITF